MNRNELISTLGSKRAVIFDLFHTLTAPDSRRTDGRPLTHVMLGVGREAWDDQLLKFSRARLAGELRDPLEIVTRMARAIDPSISDATIRTATENRVARFAATLRDLPEESVHVLRTLRSRGYRIGLVSNADAMEIRGWSDSPAADCFHATIFSCEVGHVKPEPQIYRICLEQLGVSAEEAIFVGDGGSNELPGARAVGLATVMMAGVLREHWPERVAARAREADFRIDRLAELLAES